MKVCSKCQKAKERSEFYKFKHGKDGHQTECKECSITRAKTWQEANKERLAAYALRRYHEKTKPALQANPELIEKRRARNRKRKEEMGVDGRKDADLREKYGITLADYQAMFTKQGGCCAICGKAAGVDKNGRTKLVVDHSHTTHKVRGLLCHGCNRSVGMLGDSVDGLMRAVRYLQGDLDKPEPLTFIA